MKRIHGYLFHFQACLLSVICSGFAEEIFRVECGEDTSVHPVLKRTLKARSAIACARKCVHVTPPTDSVCKGVNVCGGNENPICELVFTSINGDDELYSSTRAGCVFFGRDYDKISCNGSTGSSGEGTTEGPTDNTITGSSVGTTSGSMTTHATAAGSSVVTAATVETSTPVMNSNGWPKGTYSLLQPSSGCPSDWSSGFIQFEMDSNGNSYHSSNHIKGDVTNNLVQWYFCTKTFPDGEDEWPIGRYCILRYNGQCPSGFYNGMILFDEEDSGSHIGRLRNGTLPDIIGPSDIALMFCCRNDGAGSVTLQVTDPFYLFPFFDGPCADVVGMNNSRELTYFDCERYLNQNIVSGMTPLSYIAQVLQIYFCYYYQ